MKKIILLLLTLTFNFAHARDGLYEACQKKNISDKMCDILFLARACIEYGKISNNLNSDLLKIECNQPMFFQKKLSDNFIPKIHIGQMEINQYLRGNLERQEINVMIDALADKIFDYLYMHGEEAGKNPVSYFSMIDFDENGPLWGNVPRNYYLTGSPLLQGVKLENKFNQKIYEIASLECKYNDRYFFEGSYECNVQALSVDI